MLAPTKYFHIKIMPGYGLDNVSEIMYKVDIHRIAFPFSRNIVEYTFHSISLKICESREICKNFIVAFIFLALQRYLVKMTGQNIKAT